MFDKRSYLIKERIGFLKMTDVYDIFDPETGEQVGVAIERPPGWATFLRLFLSKKQLPPVSTSPPIRMHLPHYPSIGASRSFVRR